MDHGRIAFKRNTLTAMPPNNHEDQILFRWRILDALRVTPHNSLTCRSFTDFWHAVYS